MRIADARAPTTEAGARTTAAGRAAVGAASGAACVLLALATWPVYSLEAQPGLDGSWKIALHLAARDRLDFGHDILFTYGPLGFLANPILVSGRTAVLAVLYVAVVQIALAAVVLLAARRAFSWPIALILAYGVMALPLEVADRLPVVVLFGCVWALLREAPPRQPWLVPLGGAVAAVALLVKLNGGVVSLVLLALTVWRLRPGGWRSEIVLAGSFGATLVGLWIATGSGLGDLPAWLRDSTHLVSGYTGAMALEEPGRGWDYARAALVTALGATAVTFAVRRLPPPRAVTVSLVAAAFAFAAFKEGFVRHDNHVFSFFAALAVGALAFCRPGRLERVAVVGLAAAAILALDATRGIDLTTVYVPISTATAAVDQTRTVLDGHERTAAIEDAKERIRGFAGLDDATLAAVGRRTADVVPYESSLVWAYGLRWRPEPLLQPYLAFDSHLDRLNADALAARGADRVLRRLDWPALDGKNPQHEAPATFVSLLCHYRETHVAGRWEVLARVPSRCGRPRLLSSVEARAGQRIRIPAAPTSRDMVYARIHVPKPIRLRLQLAAFKELTLPKMILDGEPYRFVARDGPLVLRLPRRAGISPRYGGNVDYRRLVVRHVPSPFRIDFYASSIAGAGGAGAEPGALVGDRSLRVGRRSIPIVGGAAAAVVDTTTRRGGDATLYGWAADVARKRPASRVLVFSGRRLIASVRPSAYRPDVAAAYKAPALARSGYLATVRASETARGIRVFAVSDGRATEAHYPRRYAWTTPRAHTVRHSGALLGERALRLDGRKIAIVPHAVATFLDTADETATGATAYGWAGDLATGRPANLVLVFAGRRLVASGAPAVERPDVARAFHAPALERSGYRITFPAGATGRGVRVFAVSGGRASEASYPPDYDWSAHR